VDGGAIVFNDAVVFGSGDGRLYALNPKDGSEIWRLDLGEGVSTDLAFANGRIVVGGNDSNLFCIVGQ
jgi:outer membrane protein assembly factor BamB